MPTPFYHLYLTKQLLLHGNLPDCLIRILSDNEADFYFGNTLPDVQSITDNTRFSTHFYKVHKPNKLPAEEVFFQKYPEFRTPTELSVKDRVLTAGICCHLQADQTWNNLIFNPFFGMKADWESIEYRLFIHNVFRTYLDLEVFPTIHKIGAAVLQSPISRNPLPFVTTAELEEWRQLLLKPLQENDSAKTAVIFAKRLGLDAADFNELLNSKDRMNNEVFSRVPEYIIDEYKDRVMSLNTNFLIEYLPGI